MLRHGELAEVVGVEVIDGIEVAQVFCEEVAAIDEVNVFVAVFLGVFVGLADDAYTLEVAFCGLGIEGVSYEDDGELELGGADDLKERFVGVAERFGGGGIIVVIHNEAGKLARRDMLGDGKLAHRAAGEAVVDAVGVEGAADDVAIGVARAGNAAALSYGRAVEGDRVVRALGGSAELVAFFESDFEFCYARVERKFDFELFYAGGESDGFAVHFHTVGEGLHHLSDVTAVGASTDIVIYAVDTAVGEVVHSAEALAERDADRDKLGIGGEADVSAGGMVGEPAVCLGIYLFFRGVEAVVFAAVVVGVDEPAEDEGSVFSIKIDKAVFLGFGGGKIGSFQ